MFFALSYEVVADYLTRREPLRPEHLALAEEFRNAGRLVAAGALAPQGGSPDGALLVFAGDSPEVAEAFVRRDPYVREGLVTAHRVREWRVVVGAESFTPRS